MRPFLCLLLVSTSMLARDAMQGFTADDLKGVLTISEIATAQRWSIDLAKLPIRLSDCEVQEKCYVGEFCSGVCVRSAQMVGVDETRRRVYFIVNTGHSQNPPKVLFQYNLATRVARKLTTDSGVGMAWLLVSPNGRYLAYAMWWHLGLTCPPLSTATVVDLQTARLASVKGWILEGSEQTWSVAINDIKWLSNSRLAVEATIRDGRCRKDDTPDWDTVGEPKRQVVNAGALRYR